MNIVSNPMYNGKGFEDAPEEEEEGDDVKICLNGSLKSQILHKNNHSDSEEGEREVEKATTEVGVTMINELEGKEEEEEEKKEMEGEDEVMKDKEEEDRRGEKMFADSCLQTGPPAFRMVRFKQEPSGTR